MAHFGEVFRLRADGVIDFTAQGLFIVRHAAQEGNAHGNGADVQLVLVKHPLRSKDFFNIEHGSPFQIRCMA